MSTNQLLISAEKCVGCRACVKACPFGALAMDGKLAKVGDACTFCGACVPACKFGAIALDRAAREAGDLSGHRGVWVFGEQIEGEVQHVVLELVGKGRELADKLGEPLTVVLFGHNLDEQARALLEYPVDAVLQVDAPELEHYAAEPYAKALEDLIRQRKPAAVLAGATSIGRGFLARVAVAVRTGLTADCTGLDITGERQLLQTRPAFGGNIMADILCRDFRPQMATVRPKVMTMPGKSPRGGKVEKIAPDAALLASRSKRLGWIPEVESTINIADADIIVTGGRGLGKPEGFRLIEEFARAVGGAVGSSRAAVDSGWIPYSHQVGQTGKTVQPKLYIACGVSGAVQHQVGMSAARCIVAINKDKDAPIFGLANYGIVGDLYEVLPALIRELGNA